MLEKEDTSQSSQIAITKDRVIRESNDSGVLWMKQFYETYHSNRKLSTMLTELPRPFHLSFYLEALDRDVKKAHENPSIGIILCKGKDDEVVEYALSRTLSPAAIADYTTKLPDKQLLQDKLHEFFDSSVRELSEPYGGRPR
jgi:hypothetical protein